jgi:hypothetical protein
MYIITTKRPIATITSIIKSFHATKTFLAAPITLSLNLIAFHPAVFTRIFYFVSAMVSISTMG